MSAEQEPESKMSAPQADIPGMEAVGHGIYLRPHQPHELKRVLFPRRSLQPYVFKDAGQPYFLPEGYAVDDSPPMPANQFLNQVLIEESWDRFDKQMSIDVNLSVGNGVFSINSGASQTAQMRSAEEAYYALRSSFIPLWSVYLTDTSDCIAELNEFPIPVPFSYSQRAAYEAFFKRFGSHFVNRAWVGGKALLFFTVLKSSGLTKDQIQLGIKASYGVMGKGESSSRAEQTRETLQSSSQCSVAGRGGDELKLAALSALDEGKYNEWLATIRDNPQTIELEAAGIWTLLADAKKADALREAYIAATMFSAISAAFTIDKILYCVRGRKYFCYDIEKAQSEKPKLLVERWPVLADIGFDRIDAAFCGHDLIAAGGEDLSRKLYFFRKDLCARLDIDTNQLDAGFPLPFAAVFPGVTFERLDAVLDVGRDNVYFFSGEKYIRFDTKTHCADEGYPDLIRKRWVGVTFERIDAAIYWGNGKVYFFKDDHHIRYDLVTRRADPGYPKFIVGNYVEDWKFFD